MLQPQFSLGRPAPATGRSVRDGALPMWGGHVRVVLPDARLTQAVATARASLAGRALLTVEGPVPGVARLARRLAAQHPDDPRLDKMLGVLRSRVRDGLVPLADGRPDAAATAALGLCEAVQYDPRVWDRVDALAGVVLSPDGANVSSSGAALLEILTTLLVSVRPGALELLPILPDAWFGEDAEVHGLPIVGGGRVAWSLRWPGDWPRLQWATSCPGVRVTAPGLDPAWFDTRPKGMADLAPSSAGPVGG